MKGRSNGRADEIGQEMLATLMDLKGCIARAKRQHDEVRRAILELDAAGARVEPGRFACRIDTSEQRRLSVENLTALLGPDEVEKLKRAMPVTTVQTLRVQDAAGSREDDAGADD